MDDDTTAVCEKQTYVEEEAQKEANQTINITVSSALGDEHVITSSDNEESNTDTLINVDLMMDTTHTDSPTIANSPVIDKQLAEVSANQNNSADTALISTGSDSIPGVSEIDSIVAPTAIDSTSVIPDDHKTDTKYEEESSQMETEKVGDSSEEKSGEPEQPRVLRQRKAHMEPVTPRRRRVSQKLSESTPEMPKQPSSKKSTPDSESSSVEKRKLIPRRSGISWDVGSRLEAMDYLKKWYPAKIVEVDEKTADVLIHFDGWSSRFDEWVEMRSDRLRAMSQSAHNEATMTPAVTKPQTPHQAKVVESDLKIGSVVLAKWGKSSKAMARYPAVIKGLSSKTKISIQFYDGLETEVDISSVQNLHPDLQKEALHIWDIMTEINDVTNETPPPPDKKISRRESMEAKRAQQDKMDMAEALLVQLVEKSQMAKYCKQEEATSDVCPSSQQQESNNLPSNQDSQSSKEAGKTGIHSEKLKESGDNQQSKKRSGSQRERRDSVTSAAELKKKDSPHKKEDGHSKKDDSSKDIRLSAKPGVIAQKKAGHPQPDKSTTPSLVRHDGNKVRSKGIQKKRQSAPSESPNKEGATVKRRLTAPSAATSKMKSKSPEKTVTKSKGRSGGRLIVAGFSMKRRAEKQKETVPDSTESPANETLNTGPSNQGGEIPTSHSVPIKTEPSDREEHRKHESTHAVPGREQNVDSELGMVKAEKTTRESVDPMDQDTDTSSRSEAMDYDEEDRSFDTTRMITSIARVNLGKKEDLVTEAFANIQSKPEVKAESGVKPRPGRAAKFTGRKSQDAVRKSKADKLKSGLGYTMVLEPVDALPSKAFVVEENHNQFQCPHCKKGFRKDSLLESHVRHYHNRPGLSQLPPSKRRRKTLSLCSSDSERTPQSTAPPTPLASPTPPRDGVTAVISKKIASQSVTIGAQSIIGDTPSTSAAVTGPAVTMTGDVEFEAETDEEEEDDGSYQTEVVNCSCGFNEEDGLMIQCEFCCCWQHGECCEMKDGKLPDRYICFICLNTPGARESCKYIYNQDWLRNGSLPKLEFLSSMSSDSSKKEAIIRDSHGELTKLQHKLSSLSAIKRLLASAEKSDIYELALWSPDDSTAVTDESDPNAKLTDQERLLIHIKQQQDNMQSDLTDIEAKITELECEAGVGSPRPGEDLVSTSKTLQTLIHDLSKVTKLSHLLSDPHEPEIQ